MRTLAKQCSPLVVSIAVLMIFAPRVSRAQQDAVIVRFETTPTGLIIVPVRINGRGPYKLGFDIASPVTFITTRLGQSLGLMQGQPINIGGMRAGMPVSARTFAVGNATTQNLSLGIFDLPGFRVLGQSFGGMEGLVGTSFFARFRTTIDYQRKELTFKPVNFVPANVIGTAISTLLSRGNEKPPVAKAPARAVVLGLEIEDAGATTREARVKSVVPGSAAAAAGLRQGDRIIGVNERWVTNPRDLYDSVGVLVPGVTARLQVVRDGRVVELSLKTREGL